MPVGDISSRSHHDQGCLVLVPDGRLDATTYRSFRDDLVKFAIEEPRAVIVVIDQLRIGSDALLTAFTSAWMRVSEWPGVPVLLVAERPEIRRAIADSAVARHLGIYDSLDAAFAGLADPPVRRRTEVELCPVPTSSRIARDFVHTTCRRWAVAGVTDGAAEVATELVENAIVHAATDFRVRLELSTGGLAVAVRDGSPKEAVLRERGGEPANGLRLVAELARSWGCAPDSRGGKVVWAVLPVTRGPWAPS